MASLQDTKCPACGVESGPCVVQNGMPLYQVSRREAAYPKHYENPECEECRRLQDTVASAQDSYRSCRPEYGNYRMSAKSRWPKAWREESHRQELASNLARAQYEFHRISKHDPEFETNEAKQREVFRNLDIIRREGRLSP